MGSRDYRPAERRHTDGEVARVAGGGLRKASSFKNLVGGCGITGSYLESILVSLSHGHFLLWDSETPYGTQTMKWIGGGFPQVWRTGATVEAPKQR